jgi:putative nucleotidyltransferase with HDIG domain
MAASKAVVFDPDPARAGALIRLLRSRGIEAVEASSFGRASRTILDDEGVTLLVVTLASLDATAVRVLAGLKKERPGLSAVVASRLEPAVAARLLEGSVIDGLVAPGDAAGLYAAVRGEIQKKDLRAESGELYRALRKLKLEQSRHVRKAQQLERIYAATLENLMTALDLRDVETFGHSQTVAKYTEVLARVVGFGDEDRLDDVRKGALLHDIGKIAIPDAVLKKPGALSPEDWEKIRLHPELGYGLVKEIKLVPVVGDIILCHHERFDGGGYPRGLAAEAIPFAARLFAVADALDAITARRPYRKARDFKSARREIILNSGTQFDPAAVEAFAAIDIDRWEKIRFETTSHLPSIEEFSRLVGRIRK